MRKLGKRRLGTKLAVGASMAGVAMACLATAIPAGAASAPPVNGTVNLNAPSANSVIVGSGSASTYQMMQSIDTLFSNAPGCVLATGSVPTAQGSGNQQLNFSCVTDGTNVLEQIPASAGAAGGDLAYLDNPVNDVAVSDAPIGSSNGIAQLEQSRNNGTDGVGKLNATENVSAINYARSSRAPSGTTGNDISGLNFVAYAVDGVSWIHWTKDAVGATNSAKVTNLTTAQLQGIYNGTIYNWLQVGGKAAPIVVYSAQEGSGTQSTFKTALGFDPSATANLVNCTTEPAETGKGATAAFPLAGTAALSSGCSGPKVIFENELTSVATADQSNAIFFYSLGKYAEQCEGVKTKVEQFDKSEIPATGVVNQKVGAACGGSTSVGTLATGVAKIALGNINTVSPNPQTVLGGTFPIIRDLYNVYSNGSNPNIPAATPATLNYVSEVGFICKPQTIDATSGGTKIDDPATGVWYQQEIANAILSSGFIPIDASASGPLYSGLTTPDTPLPEVSGTVAHGADALLTTEAGGTTYTGVNVPGATSGGNTSIPTGPTPSGFCVVSSTDANVNS